MSESSDRMLRALGRLQAGSKKLRESANALKPHAEELAARARQQIPEAKAITGAVAESLRERAARQLPSTASSVLEQVNNLTSLVRAGVQTGDLPALLTGPLQDMADLSAMAVLQLDDRANNLALYAEQVAERCGRDAVIRVLMRENPLLNGSLLPLLLPLIEERGSGAGTPPSQVSAETLAPARATLVKMLCGLALLDVGGEAPPSNATESERVKWLLEQSGTELLGPCRSALSGHSSLEDEYALVMGSYVVFLQAFLIRSIPYVAHDTLKQLT